MKAQAENRAMSLMPTSLRLQRLLATVAIAFGLVTVAAGGSVLLGWRDPGYIVFQPLLVYTYSMAFAYIATGLLGWHHAGHARRGAGLISLANLAMLAVVLGFFANTSQVAAHSMLAMSMRTLVWLGLWLGFRRLARTADA